MEDKTPIYIMMIVGIVAVVAIVYMLAKPSIETQGVNNANLISENSNTNAISGNVAFDDIAPVDIASIGRVLFGIVLIGSIVYMYHKW